MSDATNGGRTQLLALRDSELHRATLSSIMVVV